MSLGGSAPDKIDPTAEEIELAKIGAEQWNDYVNRFLPLRSTISDKVRVNAADTDRVQADKVLNAQGFGGIGAAATAQASGGQTALRQGAAAQAVYQGASGASRARGLASAMGDQALKNRELQGLLGLVQVGHKQQADNLQSLSSLASSTTQAAMNKSRYEQQYAAQRTDDLMSALGTGVGMYGYKNGWFTPNRKGTPAPVDDLSF